MEDLITAISSYGIVEVLIIITAAVGAVIAIWKIHDSISNKYPTLTASGRLGLHIKDADEKFTAIMNRMTKLEEADKEVSQYMVNQLRETLRKIHHDCMATGKAYEDEIEHFELSYNIYHTLGGNGTADRWLVELIELPRICKDGKTRHFHCIKKEDGKYEQIEYD